MLAGVSARDFKSLEGSGHAVLSRWRKGHINRIRRGRQYMSQPLGNTGSCTAGQRPCC